jgi:predicted phosphodiesterase
MNLLILSDLHIDNGDSFGTFGWNEQEFINRLEMIRTQFLVDCIVLNGDILELYKYSLREIQTRNSTFIKYMKNKNVVYLRGNHDIRHPDAKNNMLVKNSRGKTIYIEHGHRADFINGTLVGRITGKYFLKFLKILVRWHIARNLYFYVLKQNEGLEFRTYNSYKYLRYALDLLKKYDVVVLGHTHKMEVHNTYYLDRQKKYINTGSCSFGRFQAILLDTETLEHIPLIMNPYMNNQQDQTFLPAEEEILG